MAVDGVGRAVEGNPATGAPWTVEAIAGANALYAVACSSAAQCVAVDSVGNAARSAPAHPCASARAIGSTSPNRANTMIRCLAL